MHIRKKLCSVFLIAFMLFSYSAVQGDTMTLEEIRQSLTFSYLSPDQSITEVTKGFSLPVRYNGAFIVWNSNNENSLRIEGDSSGLHAIVVRPPFGEGYATVSLTAYITKDDEMVEKNFLLHIKELDIGFTYSNNIMSAYNKFETEFLASQNIYALKNDLYLPENTDFGDVNVSYWSENSDIVTETGKITRNAQKDRSVNFYVCFTEGYETFKASYQLVVKSFTDNEINEKVQSALQEVADNLRKTYNLDGLTENLPLPAECNGVSIKWASNNTAVITDGGVIKRGQSDSSATLTVTAEFDGYSVSQSLPVTVMAAASVSGPVLDNSSGGGFGGGFGGGSGGGFGGGSGSGSGGSAVTPKPAESFNDVPSDHWAYNAISKLAGDRVINGMGNNLFSPDGLLTREQAVKIILLAMDVSVDMNVNTSEFGDCEDNSWYVPYVEAARNGGIVSGLSATRFGVGENITRQELAVMIYRVLEKANISMPEVASPEFNDSGSIAPWAADAVDILARAGIINGKDGGFAPLDNATRAETAVIIYRVISLID